MDYRVIFRDCFCQFHACMAQGIITQMLTCLGFALLLDMCQYSFRSDKAQDVHWHAWASLVSA